MSEKKYYAKLKPEVMYYSDYGLGSVQYLEVYLSESGEFVPATDRFSFTKSELAEIMGGAIYKSKFRHETQDELWRNGWTIRTDKVNGCTHWEWINPLIELVPVEEH